MTLLPIVERELRAATRRRSTFRLRWWTALLAMLVSSFWLLALWFGAGRANLGQNLFAILTGYAFGLALLAGVFLTAGAFSEERREGTLGLLFLTDLKGYDVVLGKLMAVALKAVYGLLALLPITALPLLLGGVTGAECWRMAWALINTLFVALATGLTVSTFSRDSQRAMGATLGWLLLLVAGLPALASLGAFTPLNPLWLRLAQVSPFYAFAYAPEAAFFGKSTQFWTSLLASHLLGWALLAIASRALPRLWQEGTFRVGTQKERSPWWRRRRSSPARQAWARRELLPQNPVLWLMDDALGVRWGAWAVVLLWGLVVAIAMVLMTGEMESWVLSSYGVRPFGFILKMLFAFQACRFFAEGRRNGSLELLLCTPLTNREIVRGQAWALWRNFRWPVLVFYGLLLLPAGVHLTLSVFHLSFDQVLGAALGSVASLVYCLRMTADLFALCWLGMWLALSMKKSSLAPTMTVLAVLILPSFICWLDLVADLFFILWGMTRLQQDLRWILARQYQQRYPPAVPLPVLTSSKVPPVIARH